MTIDAYTHRLRPVWFFLMWSLTMFALVHQGLVQAAGYRELQTRRPDLFHPDSGFRTARQRAPTPDDIPPPAQPIDVEQAAALLAKGALAIDVFGALQSRYDELDGTWLVGKPRSSIPGAHWLPETGRGVLTSTMQDYLKANLKRLTKGNRTRPIVVFCVSDCWMSWNAAQRIAQLGYRAVFWFALGTDGWMESGRTLVPITPIPVKVE